MFPVLTRAVPWDGNVCAPKNGAPSYLVIFPINPLSYVFKSFKILLVVWPRVVASLGLQE